MGAPRVSNRVLKTTIPVDRYLLCRNTEPMGGRLIVAYDLSFIVTYRIQS
jgi:hypothetical protein